MRKRILPLLFTSLFVLQGCSSHITSDEFLTHKVRDPVYLQPYKDSNWFNPAKHTLSEITIQHDDTLVTRGVELRVDGALNTVLYFGGHPYNSTVDDVDIARQFALLGVNFISVSSRGLDSNGNWPSVERLRRDAFNVYDQIKARNPKDFIIIHGLSLSTFFVTELTKTRKVDAIVLESVLTRIDESVEERIPRFLRIPVDRKVDPELAKLNNYPALENYNGPLLLLSGEKDLLVPPRLAQMVYQASPSMDKSIAIIEGATQGEVISHDQTLEAYLMFINLHGLE